MEAQLKFHLTEAIRLCDILEQIKDENVSDGATNIHRWVYDVLIDSSTIQNIAQTIHNKLIIVSHDGYYSKVHVSRV